MSTAGAYWTFPRYFARKKSLTTFHGGAKSFATSLDSFEFEGRTLTTASVTGEKMAIDRVP